MSSIGGMVGIGSSPGAQGLGFNATGAQLVQPTTLGQANTAYSQSQTGIQNQADFLAALQAQNGIGNQSQVYNQLQGVANGTGPNPAQAMLAQSTGANTANQAALMAGQRGAGSNVGLIARQAAQQGAANQQNAAGQAATMQAQQSLGALGQLSGIAGTQVGQQAAATGAYTGATQGEQSQILGGIANQNTAMNANQANLNDVNGKMAQAGGAAQQQLIGGVVNGISGGMFAGGGMVPHYANGTPGGIDSNTAQDTTSSAVGDPNDKSGILNPSFAGTAPTQPKQPSMPAGPKSSLGKSLAGLSGNQSSSFQAGSSIGSALGKGISSIFGGGTQSPTTGGDTTPGAIGNAGNNYATEANNYGTEDDASAANLGAGTLDAPDMGSQFASAPEAATLMAKGGKVPAMVSPGERYLPPSEVEKVAKGKKAADKAGEKIPGKAKVKGDSFKNDIVPKTLEEGGIVLPRSVMESKHPHWAAHKFVSAVLAKKQGLKGSKR